VFGAGIPLSVLASPDKELASPFSRIDVTDHRYEGRGRHMARYFQSLSAAGDCQSDQARLRKLRTLLDRSRLGRTQHAPSLGVPDGLWPPARIEQPGAVPAWTIW
jgi:hypothetical protein